MKEQINALLNELKPEMDKLSREIYAHPELGHQEVFSSKAHREVLEAHGFTVEQPYMDLKTAFRATFDSGRPGPTIAYLSEYDALPGIGHGCGHNLLGTVSTFAGILLAMLLGERGGKVVVLGTPAEETSGGKVEMADGGAFDDVDVAMVAHPADGHYKSGTSLAMQAIQFQFKGKTAHAASHPHKGINALDAAIATFNMINALREHMQDDARVHGVITKGGEAANVVPDLTVSQFYVRAATKAYLLELVEKVKNCARGAALGTGCELEISHYESSYDNLITNEALSSLYTENLLLFGAEAVNEARSSYGSLDAGNVSHVCPTIHPYFPISRESLTGHTTEFAEASLSDYALQEAVRTVAALAKSGLDLIDDSNRLQMVKKEFAAQQE